MQATGTAITTLPVPYLDRALHGIGWALSKVSPVADMGAFHYPDHPHSFVDLWRDAGGWTLRLGRTELNLDMKRPTLAP
jgi:hypothetical protein